MQARIAPSLGALEGTHNEVWGTTEYISDIEPTVFMGLYGMNDFYAVWRHKGPKYILWCGSDIRHFINGYWLDDEGKIKVSSYAFAAWIKHNCESWVENQVEYDALARLGIESQICPSFMGNVDDYKIEYKESDKTRYYASVSGDDFGLYKWQHINMLAAQNRQAEFHLYGNTKPWKAQTDNVIVHGRIPKEQMNEEIKHMTGGLRLLEFDGFSEVLAKSILWGQWPVSAIKYPHMSDKILHHSPRHPNYDGREHYIKTLNKFPWND